MLMDEVVARLDRLRRKNAAIRAWREGHRGEYPVLRPHGRPVLRPTYADRTRCILAPGRYRNAICQLVRLEHVRSAQGPTPVCEMCNTAACCKTSAAECVPARSASCLEFLVADDV